MDLARKVYQAPGDGQCFRACIASVMDVNIGEVPKSPPNIPAGDLKVGEFDPLVTYWQAIRTFFDERGFIIIKIPARNFRAAPECFHIIGGKSPRGDPAGHAVVAFGDDVVHDPSPDGLGIRAIEERWLILPIQPWDA